MRRRRPWRSAVLALALASMGAATAAGPASGSPAAPAATGAAPPPPAIAGDTATRAEVRSGRDIYAAFRAGLADPACDADTSARWSRHFAHVPKQLAHGPSEVLQLFGYVVDALREAGLPTEYALIPFVESGYRPDARSSSGPAGLWQFIAVTARNHKIAIRPGYDGRLSPVEATRAAVRYLKTLHGMFAGDWRLAVMAFNAGEYRVLGALKRHGQRAMDAEPTQLTSLAGITQAYVRKLHALSCVLAEADDREDWMRALEARQVPRLTTVDLPAGADSLEAWAARQGLDVAAVRRLNPALAGAQRSRVAAGSRVLVPSAAAKVAATAPGAASEPTPSRAETAPATAPAPADTASGAPVREGTESARTHTVARGESAWIIARRYGIPVGHLLDRNGLDTSSVLQPGTVLRLDERPVDAAAAAGSVAN